MNRYVVAPTRIIAAFSLVGLCYSGEALSQTAPSPDQQDTAPEISPPPTPPPEEQPAGQGSGDAEDGGQDSLPADAADGQPSGGPGPAAPPAPAAPAAPAPEATPEASEEEPNAAVDQGDVAQPDDPSLNLDSSEVIVMVGSRRPVRSKTDTVVPVDVVDVGTLESQGVSDMGDMLRTMVPGFNVNDQPISDAATLIRPANLRGLPPDMTLILVNGKRRHRGAVIAFLGGGVSDGAQGVDTSVIPSIALQQVEILRDGAAAQYGSDAIAGVMNFVLSRKREGVRFQARYGSTYTGDGDTVQVAGNWGLPLTEKGFLNLSAEYSASDPTNRSVQRADAQELRDNGNLAVADPAQIWGAPEVSDNVKLFFNAGVDVGENSHTYAFGNYARRSVLGGFFFRNPVSRSGVFSNDGGETYLVGDLRPDDGVACPTVPVGDDALLQQVMDDPDCFVFNELFPGGFTPQFGGEVEDRSLVAGVRGKFDSGLRWDLSGGVGQNSAAFLIKNTVNASLGPDTPTSFNPGTYIQTDQNLNFDVSYLVPRLTIDLNVAGGIEYREEKFTIVEGDRESFEIGPLFDQGFSIGSNGFPGFSPEQAGSFKRRNVAAYVDAEGYVRPNWPVGVAVRAERFDTFGSTLNGKIASRIPLLQGAGAIDSLALRAMVGTGFRAPTPGQANVSNVSTDFDINAGELINRGTIPPTNPIAQAKGGKELEPESSLNAAGGLALRTKGGLSLTTDFYYIKVTDRISQSGTQQLTPEEAAALEDSGVRGARDLSEFRFYTNAFETSTMGIDVVGTYERGWQRAGRSVVSLAYNWNRTNVDDFTPGVIDDLRIQEFEDSLPGHRAVVSLAHMYQDWRLLSRLNYYSSFTDPDNTDDFRFGPQVLVDFEAGYRLSEILSLVVGVQNVFDSFPEQSPISAEVGNLYPENAPGGTNGGFWYTRISAEL